MELLENTRKSLILKTVSLWTENCVNDSHIKAKKNNAPGLSVEINSNIAMTS